MAETNLQQPNSRGICPPPHLYLTCFFQSSWVVALLFFFTVQNELPRRVACIQPAAYGACRLETPPRAPPEEAEEDLPHVEGLGGHTVCPTPLPYNQHPVPLVNSPRGGWEGLLPPPIPGRPELAAFQPEPYPEPWPRGLPSSKDLEPSESSEETRSWESW